ncbi:MAG TPA: hypothetical protein VE575_06545 [Acidimicrobiales bacterium]|nr:hypothetical protein [Acidimicrobiales bacterium]
MRRMWLSLAVLAVGVLAAACGDDGDSGGGTDSGGNGSNGGSAASASDASSDRGQEYVDAFVATGEGSDFTDDETECLAQSWVDVIGVDQLDEATTPEEVREADDFFLADLGIMVDQELSNQLWDGMSGCVDFRELVLGQARENVPADAIACVDENLSDDLLQQIFMTSLVEGDEAVQADEELNDQLNDLAEACPGAFGG